MSKVMFGYDDKEFENKLHVLMVKPDGSKWSVLDRQDWQWARDFKWNAGLDGYVTRGISRNGKGKKIYLHKEIAARMFGEEELDGMEVDHIDRNPLNNSRRNLRLVTHQQNCWNRSKGINNTSGVPGVSWDKSKHKWRVHIANKYVGYYTTKEAATEARRQAERAMYGKFAPQ